MEKKDVNSDAKDARGEDAPATEADAGCENAPAIEPDTTSRDATTLATGAMNGDEDMFDGVARRQIIKSCQVVVNVKPRLPKKTFKSWEEFEQVLQTYEAKYYLHCRVRSLKPGPRSTGANQRCWTK
ncbi:hypothetical protein JG687_00017132 [Phytophthora cactorum]|uniref:Uncharacterized protein n=1 Tax=Phytophthora cactorum TaxID=29920 RepID=A0A8T1TT97_9STRA|nr:hypothetical protein JG687_00017132 [Phytophthora cactorum]